MPQESLTLFGVRSLEVDTKIVKLIESLIHIKDKTGEFLLRLPDGRVIDTKGWNDWEWSKCKFVNETVLTRLQLTGSDYMDYGNTINSHQFQACGR
jgi:hypothetical protein